MKEMPFPEIKIDKYYLIYAKTPEWSSMLITSCVKLDYTNDKIHIYGIPYSRLTVKNSVITENTCGYDETTPNNKGRTGFITLDRSTAIKLSLFELDDDEIYNHAVIYEV